MCKSAAEGGLRCAAHLESELANHKHNEAWEIIKSASENGTAFAEPELTPEERGKIKTKARLDVEHAKQAEELAYSTAQLNAELTKYDFVLSTKDQSQVARYLFETSEAYLQSQKDLARATKAYNTRLIEIDYNAKAQQDSGVSPEPARSPEALAKLAIARKAYDDANREALRAEDSLMAQMRQAEASKEEAYDQNLSQASRKAHDKFVEAERELRWAKQDADTAEDYDRRNFFAVFNPDLEREKAKKQFKQIRTAILEKTALERKKAMQMAPLALKDYRKGDSSSMRFTQGPLKGKFPDSIQKHQDAVTEVSAAKEKAEKLAEKRLTRETSRLKISSTAEFQEFKETTFPGTERGQAYLARGEKLKREYRLTETYENKLAAKRDALIAEGKPGEAYDAEIKNIRERRALHVTAIKNQYAKSLLPATV